MKKFVSIICCIMFISFASGAFADAGDNALEDIPKSEVTTQVVDDSVSTYQANADKTKTAIQIIQLEARRQVLNELITILKQNKETIQNKITSLHESLKQLETKKIKEDESK